VKVKIYYHDTDCGGVVYYANYLKYLEEARSEYFEERGLIIKDMLKDGIGFVVARQEVDYEAPAFYGDVLEVDSRISRSTGVRMEFEHTVKNQRQQLVVKAKTTLVCVNKNLKPKAIPGEIQKNIAAF